MKLKPEQLEGHLSKALAPVYLITGDEPLIQLECADLIRAKARDKGYLDREVFHVEAGFNWDAVLASANSLSLFAEQKFLDVRLSAKPNEAAAKALLSYCEAPPADTLLLVTAPKLDSAVLKTKWATALEKAGVLVQVWPLSDDQLPSWLGRRATSLGIRLESSAAQLLAQRVAGNLLAASQELEMLALLSGGQTITTDLIMDAVGEHARYDVYDLVRVAMLGRFADAVRILQHLQQEGAEPTLMLWAITRELRDLLSLMRLMRDGQNFDNACKQARIWPIQRQQPLKAASQRCRPPLLLNLLQEAQHLDALSKRGQDTMFWQELLLWISKLCARPLPLPFASSIPAI